MKNGHTSLLVGVTIKNLYGQKVNIWSCNCLNVTKKTSGRPDSFNRRKQPHQQSRRQSAFFIKKLAVCEENTMVAQVTLQDMKRDANEAMRSFGARIWRQVIVFKFLLNCSSCNHKVNYTNRIIRDILIKGIYNPEIQLDLLLEKSNQEMNLEVFCFIEAKEAGKRSANKLQEYQGALKLIL